MSSEPLLPSRVRWSIYLLLIALAAGSLTGRILAVNSVNRYRSPSAMERDIAKRLEEFRESQQASGVEGAELEEKVARKEQELRVRLRWARPFISGNDRSRWLTVRALVDDGTYAIDQIVTDADERAIWDTIDMVKHDRSGEPRLYSSKPPLLPTLLAGEYWLLQQATGWTLADNPHSVVRTMLITLNVGGMIVMLLALAGLAERFGATDFGRVTVVAAGAFATLLNPFAIALTNHLVAAVSASVALYFGARIWYDGSRRPLHFAMAGLFAAFTAANELPALTLLGLLGLGLLVRAPKPTLLFGLPAALLVAAAALGTNYAAHKTIAPAYAHREPGKDWQSGNWYNYTYFVGSREIPSYWKQDEESIQNRAKIDRGEPSRATYLFHSLIGHHGLFSLTPMWLLSLAGVAIWVRNRERDPAALAWMVAIATAVCFTFYMLQGQENRNYGGTSSALRWMLWFAPLWLAVMLPAADWASRTRGRQLLALLLIALSALSASYPTWNPWQHPWIAVWMEHMGWLEL